MARYRRLRLSATRGTERQQKQDVLFRVWGLKLSQALPWHVAEAYLEHYSAVLATYKGNRYIETNQKLDEGKVLSMIKLVKDHQDKSLGEIKEKIKASRQISRPGRDENRFVRKFQQTIAKKGRLVAGEDD
jgi:hypothetical protein